jgi:hypothetical protein
LYWFNKSLKVVYLYKIIQSHRPNVKEPDPSFHTKAVRMLYDNRKWIFDGEDDSYNDWEMRCSVNYADFDYTPPKFTVRNPELRHPSVIGSYGQLDVKVSTKMSEQYYNYPHVTGLLLCCTNMLLCAYISISGIKGCHSKSLERRSNSE